MGLINRILGLITGNSGRFEDLIKVLKTRLEGPDGAITLGLQGRPRAGFDRMMDALNRLPRPIMALGTVALIAAALIDPVWFAARMEAMAQIPEPLWWLIGAVISLFFGARFQSLEQNFQREIVGALASSTQTAPVAATSPLAATTGADAPLTLASETPTGNPALTAWQTTVT